MKGLIVLSRPSRFLESSFIHYNNTLQYITIHYNTLEICEKKTGFVKITQLRRGHPFFDAEGVKNGCPRAVSAAAPQLLLAGVSHSLYTLHYVYIGPIRPILNPCLESVIYHHQGASGALPVL